MKISKNRILYLDEVRSLAIIFVVLGHIIRSFSKDFFSWFICTGIFSVTRIGVPLFFTVSGALLLTKKHDILQFLEKRFKRVMIPFMFWIIVYIILGVLLWKMTFSYEYCLEIILGSSDLSSPFWFIWSLIGIYLLIPMISSFIREYGDFAYKYFIVITVVLSVLTTIGFFSIDQAKNEFRVIFNFFSVLGFFILGSYIQNNEFNMSRNRAFLLGVILFIVGYAGHFTQNYYLALGGFGLKPVNFFNIFVVAQTMGLFIAFKYADVKMISSKLKPLKEQKLGEIILLFSSCSFGIYFAHYPFTLWFLKHGFMVSWTNSLWYFPLSSLIIVGLCWILIQVMSKIPVLKIFSGVK